MVFEDESELEDESVFEDEPVLEDVSELEDPEDSLEESLDFLLPLAVEAPDE